MRAGFLRRDVVRPYGAVAPEAFARLCDGCGECVRACPETILLRGDDGLAQIDPARGACTFCEVCIETCPTGALTAAARSRWDWVAQAGNACLSAKGITCRTCEDRCDARAIRFRLETGGRSRPVVDEAACTGCGACVAACPAGAVTLVQPKPVATEVTA